MAPLGLASRSESTVASCERASVISDASSTTSTCSDSCAGVCSVLSRGMWAVLSRGIWAMLSRWYVDSRVTSIHVEVYPVLHTIKHLAFTLCAPCWRHLVQHRVPQRSGSRASSGSGASSGSWPAATKLQISVGGKLCMVLIQKSTHAQCKVGKVGCPGHLIEHPACTWLPQPVRHEARSSSCHHTCSARICLHASATILGFPPYFLE